MSIKEFISSSGDSHLSDYSYTHGVLEVLLTLSETNQNVRLDIRTDTIAFDIVALAKSESIFKTCRIELIELCLNLTSQNGFYVPSSDFAKLMQETRAGFNMAYGRRVNDVECVLSFVGYTRLISCLVYNVDCVKYKFEI